MRLYQIDFILKEKIVFDYSLDWVGSVPRLYFCSDPKSICYCSLYRMSSPLPLENKGWALKSWV